MSKGAKLIEAIVINRLSKWAIWKHKGATAGLGYPSQSPFMRLAPASTYFNDPGLDSDCSLTESAFKLLPIIHQSVIWVEYMSGKMNFNDKAHYFGRSVRNYRKCLEEAYAGIGNVLDTLMHTRQEAA